MQNKKKSKRPFFERALNKTVLGQGHFSNKPPCQKKKHSNDLANDFQIKAEVKA